MRRRRSTTLVGRFAAVVAKASAVGGMLAGGHLLTLLFAALASREEPEQSPRPAGLNLVVVVPAHDEEDQITRTLRSIQTSGDPGGARIVVIADNCTDHTADIARYAGAEVWERVDPVRRGKGQALAWAFSRMVDDTTIDAVCVVDADCEISANLLPALAARLAAGAEAVQAPYLISNPHASSAAALRWAGFALFNVVRPLGRDRLGLSSGLLGTGMAFSRRLLERSPWSAFSYAEDRDQHMRWVLDGARVEFVPEARVVSAAPSTAAAGQAQRARWDSGRAQLAVRLSARLLRRWLRTGELAALDAALEPLLPPQSALLGINLLAFTAAAVARRPSLVRMAACSASAQVIYVAGGLVVLDAPASVWRALPDVPRFAARRVAGLAGMAAGRGPAHWERTQRDTEQPAMYRTGSGRRGRSPVAPSAGGRVGVAS
jgi:hypothetical protein